MGRRALAAGLARAGSFAADLPVANMVTGPSHCAGAARQRQTSTARVATLRAQVTMAACRFARTDDDASAGHGGGPPPEAALASAPLEKPWEAWWETVDAIEAANAGEARRVW